jgi:hypothetical protein
MDDGPESDVLWTTAAPVRVWANRGRFFPAPQEGIEPPTGGLAVAAIQHFSPLVNFRLIAGPMSVLGRHEVLIECR